MDCISYPSVIELVQCPDIVHVVVGYTAVMTPHTSSYVCCLHAPSCLSLSLPPSLPLSTHPSALPPPPLSLLQYLRSLKTPAVVHSSLKSLPQYLTSNSVTAVGIFSQETTSQSRLALGSCHTCRCWFVPVWFERKRPFWSYTVVFSNQCTSHLHSLDVLCVHSM